MKLCDGIAKGVYLYSTLKSTWLLSNFTAPCPPRLVTLVKGHLCIPGKS